MNDASCESGSMEGDDVSTQGQGCLHFFEGLATSHQPSQNTDVGQHFQVGNPVLGIYAGVMGSNNIKLLGTLGKAERVRQMLGSWCHSDHVTLLWPHL